MSIRIEADITHPAPKTLRQEIGREALSNPIRIESPHSQGIPSSPKRPSLRETLGFSQEKIQELISSLPNLTEEDRLLLTLRMEKRIVEVAHDFHVGTETIYYKLRQIRKKLRSEFEEGIPSEIEAVVLTDQRKFNPGRPRKNKTEGERRFKKQPPVKTPDFLAREAGEEKVSSPENKIRTLIRKGRKTDSAVENKYSSLSPEEEINIVFRAQKGDEEAVVNLYNQYQPRIFYHILTRIGNTLDAEDLTQDVFEKLILAIPRFEFRGVPFSAWVYQITNNTLASFWRKREVRNNKHGLLVEHSKNIVSQDTSLDLEEFVEKRMLASQALSQTSKLSKIQREVIYLRFAQGLSVADTAVQLGKKAANVKVIQHKAITRLKAILARDGFYDIIPPSSLNPSLLRLARRDQLRQFPQQKIELLPSYLYRIVDLYLAGQSKEEVSEAFGIHPKRVTEYLSLAMRYLNGLKLQNRRSREKKVS